VDIRRTLKEHLIFPYIYIYLKCAFFLKKNLFVFKSQFFLKNIISDNPFYLLPSNSIGATFSVSKSRCSIIFFFFFVRRCSIILCNKLRGIPLRRPYNKTTSYTVVAIYFRHKIVREQIFLLSPKAITE
jgi:hypothetical protein